MSTLARRESRMFGDLFDWMDAPLAVFRPWTAQNMRMETFVRDDSYVVRAELPGVDPDKEIDVTVSEGILQIRAERHEEKREKTHSEFRYGTLSRTLTLPSSADEDNVKASYDKGILEVSVGLKTAEKARKAEHHIPVKAGK